ncbi:MAG TPA: RNA 2',3'-cyclic phosphodiesterase [Dehalococcoidia bacterium]|jgi:2'-5' RNA ligase|nr:RNA 2',3'-cyclic phosphodiesterase [Dehalococcoidia bacterium]
MPDSLRLFVAVELPGEVREALGRLQHELQRRGLEGLRWVRPEGIHLTLKFLGATPVEKVSAIEEALARVVPKLSPFAVWLGHFDTFRGEKVPRVVWVGLSSTGPDFYGLVGSLMHLERLYLQVEKALAPLGFPTEKRGFTAHLTLARVRQGTAPEMTPRIREAVNDSELWQPIIEGVRWDVTEISLMRSTLRPSGAVYERVAAFRLGAA